MSQFLEKIGRYCEAGEISTANAYVYFLHKDQSLPSTWFSSATDHLVAQVVAQCISAFSKKPMSPRDVSELGFVNQLLTIACGPALVEEISGMNEPAKRWMTVFRDSLQACPPTEYHFEITLWLFTLYDISHTLMGEGLRSLLQEYCRVGPSEKARKHRNRSLCQFRTRLLDLSSVFSKDFGKKLKGSGEFDHCCFGCFQRRIRLICAPVSAYSLKIRIRQWQLQRHSGAPLRYR